MVEELRAEMGPATPPGSSRYSTRLETVSFANNLLPAEEGGKPVTANRRPHPVKSCGRAITASAYVARWRRPARGPAKFGNSAIRASRRFTTSSAFETQPRPCRQTQSRGDLRVRTGDRRHGRERRGDRAVEGRPFVRLAIPAHRVTLQALGFMPYAAARRRLSASAIGTLPVSQSRISPVVGDCVVELVGLELTTKVLWNMVGVRPTTLVGHLSGLPGGLLFCLIFLAF